MLFLFIAASAALLAWQGAATAAAQRPNIVLIVADDLGYGDLSSYGGRISTPSLDALARASVRFTDFHSNAPYCTPTRAALMTGRYPHRAKLFYALPANSTTGLPASETTIAEILKAAGYATGLVGKWHLGHLDRFHPLGQGFGSFFGFLKGEIDYVNHLDAFGHLDWWRMKGPVTVPKYSTTVITDEAIAFIRRNASRPFFLTVAYQAPHTPYQGPGDPAIRKPNQPAQGLEGDPTHYPAMVQAMDQGIGRIVSTLSSLNLRSRTIVFFLSDNGGLLPYGCNKPCKAGKGSVYEGGHRVPALVSWPTIISPRVRNDTLATFDIFPTVLELAAIAAPPALLIDGTSFAPLLLHQETMPARRLFWTSGTSYAVRDGKWKMTVISGNTSLFDLSNDMAETTNLALSKPEIVAALRSALNQWKADVGAP